MTDPLQDLGVQGLAQLGRNAVERVAQLEAELAGYVEANKHMKGELDDALEDARRFAEAQREIARLRDALSAVFQYGSDTLSGPVGEPDDRKWQRAGVLEMTRRARAALAQVAEVPK